MEGNAISFSFTLFVFFKYGIFYSVNKKEKSYENYNNTWTKS